MVGKCLFFVALSACLFQGCSPSTMHTAKEYNAWLNNPENHCKVSKKVGNMVISMKYMPPQFLALKEYESTNRLLNYDSLLSSYEHSVTFLMSFETKQGQEGEDVMYKDLASYKEYLERSMTLNFDMESKVQLQGSFGSCYPVLSSLENTYGLSKGRDVYLVFSSKEKAYDLMKEAYWDLVYQDDIYQTGILHFIFTPPVLKDKLPEITL